MDDHKKRYIEHKLKIFTSFMTNAKRVGESLKILCYTFITQLKELMFVILLL